MADEFTIEDFAAPKDEFTVEDFGESPSVKVSPYAAYRAEHPIGPPMDPFGPRQEAAEILGPVVKGLAQPVVPLPRFRGTDLPSKIVAPLANIAMGMGEFIESPLGAITAPIGGTEWGAPLVRGIFGGLAAKEAGRAAGEAYVTKTPEAISEAAITTALAPFILKPGRVRPPGIQGPPATGEVLATPSGAVPPTLEPPVVPLAPSRTPAIPAEPAPTTPTETVKLYHGEGGTEGAGMGSLWFTKNPDRARTFGPRMTVVEVPKSVVDQFAVKGTAGDVVLPDEWVVKAEPVENVPEQKVYEIPEGPTPETAAKPTANDLEPALLVDGKPVTGGVSHQGVYDAAKNTPGVDPVGLFEALADDSKHVFIDKNGKVYTRREAADALGEKDPLQSSRLAELKARKPAEAPVKPAEIAPEEMLFSDFDRRLNDELDRQGTSRNTWPPELRKKVFQALKQGEIEARDIREVLSQTEQLEKIGLQPKLPPGALERLRKKVKETFPEPPTKPTGEPRVFRFLPSLDPKLKGKGDVWSVEGEKLNKEPVSFDEAQGLAKEKGGEVFKGAILGGAEEAGQISSETGIPLQPKALPAAEPEWMGRPLSAWESFTDPANLPKGEERARLAKSLSVVNQPSKIAARIKQRLAEIRANAAAKPAAPVEAAPAAPVEPTLAPPAPSPTTPVETAPDAAKVETEVAKVAATEGQRPAKEVKSELVSRLEKAIQEAPSEFDAVSKAVQAKGAKVALNAEKFEAQKADVLKDIPKTTIDIPGDGTFTIPNTKEALTEVLGRAKKISTASGAPVKVTQRGVSKEKAQQFLKEAEQPPPQSMGPGAAAAAEFEQPPSPEVLQLSAGNPILNRIQVASRNLYEGLRQLFKRGGEKRDIMSLANAADNVPRMTGQQAGNAVRLRTTEAEQNALTYVMQALKMSGDGLSQEAAARLGDLEYAGDPLGYLRTKATDMETLAQQFKNQGKNLNAQAAIDAARNMRYAAANFARLRPLATQARRQFDAQIRREANAGIDVDYERWYVPQRHELDLFTASDRPIVLGHSRGSGTSTGFKKAKVFEDYATAIENGFIPRSTNIADLLEHRVHQGERLIAKKSFFDGLMDVSDPVDQKPLAMKIPRRVIQRADGTTDVQESVPLGYTPFEVIPGYRLAVHDGYSRLMRALTSSSQISESAVVGTLQDIAAVEKHIGLALDTFHLSRTLQAELALTGRISVGDRLRLGRALVEYNPRDLDAAVAKGEITQEMADFIRTPQEYQIGGRSVRMTPNEVVMLGSKNGLNVARFNDVLYRDWLRNVPVTGYVNKLVFDKITRSAISQGFLAEFDRVTRAHPEWDATRAARNVSRDINVLFGNLQKESIFRNPSLSAINQIVFLAPRWVEALARREGRTVRQFGEAARDIAHGRVPRLGTVGKAMGTGLAAYVVGTQILNLITRHHLTFSNPEPGHKLDAWIPDVTGKTKGFFISPLSVFGEITHDILRYAEQKPDLATALTQIGANKLGNLGRFLEVVATGRDPMTSEKLIGTSRRAVKAATQLVPVPISLSQGARAVAAEVAPGVVAPPAPGTVQRQLTASAGFKTEPAASAQQQIYSLVDRWKAQGTPKQRAEVERRLKEDFGPSDYRDLRGALLRDDLGAARAAYNALRETKEPQIINRAMAHPHPFTGSAHAEGQFRASLTPEQKETYREALKEREKLYRKFRQMLRETR